MKNLAALSLAAVLINPGAALVAQTQSPDTQQEGHADSTKTAPKATQPTSEGMQPPTGQSPDIQQEKNGGTGSKKNKKNRNNAHQAHGTPHPRTDTNTSTEH